MPVVASLNYQRFVLSRDFVSRPATSLRVRRRVLIRLEADTLSWSVPLTRDAWFAFQAEMSSSPRCSRYVDTVAHGLALDVFV